MAARVCLVHYHEVGLKGKNRAHFEHILMDNIKAALAAFSVNAVSRISGYILVTFNEHQADEAARVIRTVPRRCSRVPGISHEPRPAGVLRRRREGAARVWSL